jgi:hypothetical protein
MLRSAGMRVIEVLDEDFRVLGEKIVRERCVDGPSPTAVTVASDPPPSAG